MKCFSNTNANRLSELVSAGIYLNSIIPKASLLNTWNVTIYYFASRADSNAYMAGKYPGFTGFTSTTSRCGNTGFHASVNMMGQPTPVLASEIYDTCSYTTQNPPDKHNMWLTRVLTHEVGHSFDFGLSALSTKYGTPISATTGFKAMVTGIALPDRSQISDLPYLDNGHEGGGAPPTCSVYGTYTMTPLELNLGAKYPTPVCVGNTIQPNFTGQFNSTIAAEEEPYFITPASNLKYNDIFAESFAYFAQEQGPGGKALPQMDQLISSLRCSEYVAVSAFVNTAQPPTAQNLQTSYCPAETAANFNF